MEAYLKHGKAGEPMLTEHVEIAERTLPWQDRGLSWTASGYGDRIPTKWVVRWNGRWRRVYCYIHSNIGTLFIGKRLANGIVVDIYD